jgi:hypothetical protein
MNRREAMKLGISTAVATLLPSPPVAPTPAAIKPCTVSLKFHFTDKELIGTHSIDNKIVAKYAEQYLEHVNRQLWMGDNP